VGTLTDWHYHIAPYLVVAQSVRQSKSLCVNLFITADITEPGIGAEYNVV